MPAGDRTGPAGMGPRTGRGMGRCNGSSGPGYVNPGPGKGNGGGRMGRGQDSVNSRGGGTGRRRQRF